MKHIYLLLSLILSTACLHSQESWIRIYSQSGWNIEEFYKTGSQNSQRSILIRHNWSYGIASLENGNVKAYNRNSNSWYLPARGSLSTTCAQCVDPPVVWTECRASDFFMISQKDSNFIVSFRITLCASCPDATTLFTWNGGLNWANYYGIFGVGGTFISPNGGDFDPANDSVLYYGFSNSASGYQPAVFKSTDRGANWQLMQVIPNLRNAGNHWGFPGEQKYGFILASPFSSDVIFANHRDNLLRSTDAGASFAPTALPALKELSFDRTRSRLLGIDSSHLYISGDNGANWTSVQTPVMFNTVEPVEGTADVLFAGSGTGLYRSSNGGQSWHLYNNTFSPSKKVIGICKDPGSADTLIVCTADAVYKVFRDELTVQELHAESNPVEFALHQNFPNPFNPSTVIGYSISKRGSVSLSVFNSLGKEVATLVDKVQGEGYYSVKFDASELSAGVYYYRLNAEGFSISRKMLLLK